jgi:hypothetical protein
MRVIGIAAAAAIIVIANIFLDLDITTVTMADKKYSSEPKRRTGRKVGGSTRLIL